MDPKDAETQPDKPLADEGLHTEVKDPESKKDPTYDTKMPVIGKSTEHKLKPLPETVDFEARSGQPGKPDPERKLRDKLSRELVTLLRHTAINKGLHMRDDGFVRLDDILAVNSLTKKGNLEIVRKLVDENNKKRLELTTDDAGVHWIRAVQGHTLEGLDEDKLLRKITDPAQLGGVVVVHGTTDEAWQFIRKTGLNKMSRNHIHFARGYPGDKEVISGMRQACEIFVELDVPLALLNGIKIMESSNGVILSSGVGGVISPLYFKHVFRRLPDGSRQRIFGNDDLPKLKEEFLYRYLFVLDFEANCLEGQQLVPQEIIEFPVVVVDTQTDEILHAKTFHYYIRPDVHPLSPFCTQLTGITQATVDKGIPLAEALTRFQGWVADNKFNLDDCSFITCGNWDLKTCLANEAAYRNIALDPFFKRYINLKEVFRTKFNAKSEHFGMPDMLTEFGLALEGKHHSGIDDVKNLARVVQAMGRSFRFIGREFAKIVV